MTKFYEGQEVECLVYGKGGKIFEIPPDKSYIYVEFPSSLVEFPLPLYLHYYADGKLIEQGERTLYPAGTVRVVELHECPTCGEMTQDEDMSGGCLKCLSQGNDHLVGTSDEPGGVE